MIFIKEKDFLKNRLNKVKRYKTKEEKELLLFENENILELVKILDTPEPINELEAIAFLIKAREISVSDILEGFKDCDNCKVLNEFQIDLTTVINLDIEVPEYPNFPIGLFEKVEDIINENEADELTITEYNKIEDIIKRNNNSILNLVKTFNCRIPSCKHKNFVDINPIEILSKVTLPGLYDEVFRLSFFTNNDINSIENMYPFERNLYLKLLQKHIESED